MPAEQQDTNVYMLVQTGRQTAGISFVQALPAGMEATAGCGPALPHLVIRPPCPPAPEGDLPDTLLQTLLHQVGTSHTCTLVAECRQLGSHI